mmetsp:Transcript_23138/g.32342  ORF Transcript_23138/g.32342 Transcript_23138/m.32342 type:complete len:153 (-) Transcript_23138:304-762(-)|eukprot:CAMPEP_0185263782 /NCGR_PEP_ID=MMETSP1359-20130426/16479_1 /TAXON_ID=552665 /ORGANISM="Bigelowiella longifila, Strain CCMP242" /LENGTH=152 /DNA_ID=CAMNT_0027851585 /DNA_START=22 /DNA_END=480 /DNA_ORIENTATION=+
MRRAMSFVTRSPILRPIAIAGGATTFGGLWFCAAASEENIKKQNKRKVLLKNLVGSQEVETLARVNDMTNVKLQPPLSNRLRDAVTSVDRMHFQTLKSSDVSLVFKGGKSSAETAKLRAIDRRDGSVFTIDVCLTNGEKNIHRGDAFVSVSQ